MIKQNQSLNPGLTIAHVAWPGGVRDTPKLFSSLTVFLRTPEQANQVIARGFAEEGKVKYIERFHTGCGLVQCFKCCGYGHIAKNCRLSASCGHCAQDHETRGCPKKDLSFCICCIRAKRTKTTHKAWAETCPTRIDTREELHSKLRSGA